MDKVIRDNKVGVLVSYGWGAGFYTWGAPEEAIFSPQLIELIENEKYDEAIKFVETTWPGVYTGGVEDLEVVWIPVGTKFIIRDEDGNEWLELLDEMKLITA